MTTLLFNYAISINLVKLNLTRLLRSQLIEIPKLLVVQLAFLQTTMQLIDGFSMHPTEQVFVLLYTISYSYVINPINTKICLQAGLEKTRVMLIH